MGKNLWHKQSRIAFENHHPRCMQGVLRILDYHRWRHVKRILPHKRHNAGRHVAGAEIPGNNINAPSDGEVHEDGNVDMENTLDNQIEGETLYIPVSNSSRKARLKGVLAEGISKERGKHHRTLTYPSQSHLTRTDSIHHREPSDEDRLGQLILSYETSDIVPNDIENTPVSNISYNDEDPKFHLDEKLVHLFMKVLQNPDSFLSQHLHNRRVTKSESFPVVGSSGKRKVGPIKLKHESEITENSTVDEIYDHAVSPSRSPRKQKTWGDNKMVMKRFKNLRQRIKHVIKESRKEGHRITMDSIIHKIPYGRKFSKDMKKIGIQWKEPVVDAKNISSVSRSIRRTSSLNESLDRYCQLYECSFNTDCKERVSERVKLRMEEVQNLGNVGPRKSLGRILSLPDLKSFGYLQRDDNSRGGTFSSGLENQAKLDELVKREEKLQDGGVHPIIENEKETISVTNDEANATIDDTSDDSSTLMNENLPKVEPSQVPMLNPKFEEEPCSPVNSLSDCPEVKPIHLISDEQDESPLDSPTLIETKVDIENVEVPNKLLENNFQTEGDIEKLEIPNKLLENNFLRIEVDSQDKVEFDYVKDILELSGLLANDFFETWHSSNYPVDASIFTELEQCSLLESNDSRNEVDASFYHLLLFDLINEILVDIYERSFTYCPVPLSSRCHVRPWPKGDHILEEVWTNVSWYLSLKPEADQPLDQIQAQDLSKADGWMNLQFDTEFLVLELDDLIFDDLLEEVIFS